MPEIIVDTTVTEAGAGQLWGLEGRHTWDEKITLNDKGALPRYNVHKITGLASLGDSEDKRENAVGRVGEVVRRSNRRGKTIGYEGDIEATSMAELRAMERDLRAAFADQQTEKQMVVTPHPSYDSGSRYFVARALDLTIADEQGSPLGQTYGFSRAFGLTVRMSDPRYYDSVAGTATAVATASGAGASPPFTPPFTLPAAGLVAGTVLATPHGTAGSDLSATIQGPITDPVLENTTRGLTVALSGLTLGPPDFVQLFFSTPRRILLNGVVNANHYLDEANSSWWSVDPPLTQGDQSFRITGTNGEGATVEWVWHDAYW